jgi:hypothetical protein
MYVVIPDILLRLSFRSFKLESRQDWTIFILPVWFCWFHLLYIPKWYKSSEITCVTLTEYNKWSAWCLDCFEQETWTRSTFGQFLTSELQASSLNDLGSSMFVSFNLVSYSVWSLLSSCFSVNLRGVLDSHAHLFYIPKWYKRSEITCVTLTEYYKSRVSHSQSIINHVCHPHRV